MVVAIGIGIVLHKEDIGIGFGYTFESAQEVASLELRIENEILLLKFLSKVVAPGPEGSG